MEKYLLKVIRGQENGFKAKIVNCALKILAKIYYLIIKIRSLAYKLGLKRSHKVCAPVISIGNITVGGTGKTPLVKLLAQKLQQKELRPAILSRGYRAEYEGQAALVADEEEILMDAKNSGDESFLLAQMLPGVPIAIGKERKVTGKYICNQFDSDFIILDDGFQHWQLKRDYDIVVIDGTNPFANGKLLPAGLLREPLSSLKRANLLVITKADQINQDQLREIKRVLAKHNSQADIITTRHKPGYLRKIGTGEREEIDLADKKVVAVSGIGNPDSFIKTLKDLEAEVVADFAYPDHHNYNQDDIMEIFTTASSKQADLIVTTEKDAVSIEAAKIAGLKEGEINLKVLGIEIDIIDGEDSFKDFINQLEGCK